MKHLKYAQSIYDTSPVQAIYSPQVNPMYQGNPLIEALEYQLSPEQIMDITGSYPPYTDDLRFIEDRYERMSMIPSFLGAWREPLGTDVTLFLQLREVICKGYIRNNPLNRGYYDEVDLYPEDEHLTITPSQTLDFIPPSAYGFTVPGDSGTGKSTTIQQIARVQRPMILHTHYDGKIFHLRQIPIIVVVCPESGALNIFVGQFFHAVDDIAHTKYYKRYMKKRLDNTELKRAMKTVCRLHGIGVIIVDEAQNLVSAKRGFEQELLAFYVTFHETVKVPLVLVGTPKFEEIWKESFSAGRRFLGESPVEFRHFTLDLSENSVLISFCKGMWKYQFGRKKIPMTEQILRELFFITQGNPDLMKKAVQFVQAQSIKWGLDDQEVTAKNFSAIKGKFGPVEDALNALRLGDRDLIEKKFKDLRPPSTQKKKNRKAKSETPQNSKESVKSSLPTDNAASMSDAQTSTENPLKAKSKRAKKRVENVLSQPEQPEAKDKNKKANENYIDLDNQGLVGFAPQTD